MRQEQVNKTTVLLFTGAISIAFAILIRGYVFTLVLSGLFSALSYPLYLRLLRNMPKRKNAASALTLAIMLLIVIIPLAGMLSIVIVQAVQVGQNAGPWIREILSQSSDWLEQLKDVPGFSLVMDNKDEIISRAGQFASTVGTQLVNNLSKATSSTVQAVFLFFIFLYSMFFFLKDGDQLINLILYYIPLEDEPERKLLDHFTSVTRATLKGTLLIGLIQGSLAGIGFAVAGIPAVLFWAMVMTVLSIIPLIGSSLVWIPAVIIMAASGRLGAAIALGIYCAIVVGTVDNILRPIMVGKDTKMHELLILLSSMGGIGLFGIWGVIIGPVIAALFVSIWDLYGKTFASYLPEVVLAGPKSVKQQTLTEDDSHEDVASDPSDDASDHTDAADSDAPPSETDPSGTSEESE